MFHMKMQSSLLNSIWPRARVSTRTLCRAAWLLPRGCWGAHQSSFVTFLQLLLLSTLLTQTFKPFFFFNRCLMNICRCANLYYVWKLIIICQNLRTSNPLSVQCFFLKQISCNETKNKYLMRRPH